MPTDPHDLLVLLNDLGRLIRVEADRRARVFGLTRAQWLIMARLERSPGLSQSELAGILEVEPITVARLVDRLEGAGFVERRPDPSDRRIWRLHLLDAAANVLRPLLEQKDEIIALLTDGVAPDDIEAARAVLAQMRDNMTSSRRRDILETA